MAIQSASAKLYTGIRCWVVDKNISAALTSSFSLVNQNQPSPVLLGGVPTVYANVRVFRLKRAVADLVLTPSVTLTDSRLKTFGGGNVINDGYFVQLQRYKIIEITPGSDDIGTTDWNAVAGTTGVTYAAGDEITAVNSGSITGTGKAALARWTARSSVVCKFPTYFRIDVEKLQLPEGTTCTVEFEEGWIKDGEYLESTRAVSPAVKNFFTFRTPWYGLSFMNSAFSLPNTVLRIKQLASSVSSTASFTALPIFNPGKLAALFGGVFLTVPNAVKTARTSANLFNSFGPLNVGGTPILATILKIKQLASDFIPSSTTLTSMARRFRGTQIAMSTVVDVVCTPYQ